TSRSVWKPTHVNVQASFPVVVGCEPVLVEPVFLHFFVEGLAGYSERFIDRLDAAAVSRKRACDHAFLEFGDPLREGGSALASPRFRIVGLQAEHMALGGIS